MTTIETRERLYRSAEIRAKGDGTPGVTLHAIRPEVVDDYGSLWMADAFDESLSVRMPFLCWGHDWSEPLGPATGYRTGADGPDIDFVFSDFDAVPMARRAHAQVVDGTILDCSVGFWDAQRRDPTDDEVRQYPGIREVILKAQLDEVSLVGRGAVPGAKVKSFRSAEQVRTDAAAQYAAKIAAGEMTHEEAHIAIDLLAAADPAPEGEPPPAPEPVDHDALDAEVDAALAGRSRR